jgi:5-methylthioadenosine/S-adenosylhomocysteine deaminase
VSAGKSDRLWVRGGTVVTMDPQHRVLEGDVLVHDGRIVAIGSDLDEAQTRGAKVLDATAKVVLPGFVQGHVHLGQALLRGLAEGRELLDWLRERIWPLEAAHDHESAYWSGMLGAADCLLSGTTTVQEIGLVTHMEAIFESIRDSGLRAVAGKCLMDTGLGVPEALLEDPDDALAQSAELHGRWHGAEGGRIHVELCPRFILSCSKTLWEGTARLATQLGVPVHTHLLEHPREEDEVVGVLGRGQMEFLDETGILDTDLRIAHGVQFGPKHVQILAGRPLRIAHCPSANLKLGSGIADLGFLRSTPGVSVGLGTDGAPCNNDMDVLEEMRLAALLQALRQGPGRFSGRDALSLATIDGARALGLESEIGSLEIGKAGDLVVLDLERPATFGPVGVDVYDRIVFAAARDAVCWVVVGGAVLVDHGRLLSFDEQALRDRPAQSIRAVLKRSGIAI